MAPVVIPALAPSLDRSLKGDRSLCPVRTLRYYLDRTSDLRQNKELVFVSFKKGFDKDISPATFSSWIKQTVTCFLWEVYFFWDLLPLGSLFLLGLNSAPLSLSFPSQTNPGKERKKGGQRRQTPD